MANKTIGQLTSASTIALNEQTTVIPIFQAEQAGSENGATYKADFEQIIDNFSLAQNGSTVLPVNDGDVANKKYVDEREAAINSKIATDITQASTAINNNINTAINDLPFWDLQEIEEFKGKYYFNLKATNKGTTYDVILYYIPGYIDGSMHVQPTWYLTSKNESIQTLLSTSTVKPNITIADSQNHNTVYLILGENDWQKDSSPWPPQYPLSAWYCVKQVEDSILENNSYYIQGTLGGSRTYTITINSNTYSYRSDYYNGKQLKSDAVPYATSSLLGGIKIGNGLNANIWGECDVLIGNGLKFDSLNQIALNINSSISNSVGSYLFTSFHAQGSLTHSAANTWTKVGTFSIPAGKALIGSIKTNNHSGIAYGLGWAYGADTQYPQCTVYETAGGYKVCPIVFSPSDPTNEATISIFTYRTSASSATNSYGVGGVLIDASYFGSYENDATASSTTTINQA